MRLTKAKSVAVTTALYSAVIVACLHPCLYKYVPFDKRVSKRIFMSNENERFSR
jgi:hypothetical protein